MNVKEEILQRTNRGLDIFYFYMPINFVPKRNFRNPLYDDKRASCNIYLDAKSDCYRMKDFGNDLYSGDCFWFAATMQGLDAHTEFMQVLETIIRDLQLSISLPGKARSAAPVRKAPNSGSVALPQSSEHENTPWNKGRFSIVEQPYRMEELAFWGRYGIDTKTLQRFRVKSLSRFESVSNQGKSYTLRSTVREPMFCYAMGAFVKVYRPFSTIRFLYAGNKTDDYVFGFEQLPNKGDMLFITGGEKDVMSLAAHGFHAICFNSETAQIPENIVESLRLRFRHIILLYDTDETGKRESERQVEQLAGYHVLNLTLPLQGSKGEKDISDYFQLGYGEKDLRALLSEMFSNLYVQTMMMLRSCEIDYDNPSDASRSVVAVNGVPLGTQDNLFCITGGEGTGKSNYITAILAGTLGETILPAERTLGLDVTANPKRLAGIYNTCIICVLHFVPNGIKLCGHIGSELQRKAAGILSIEKDDDPEYSVVKALKVRDGSPLDVPIMLFGWDKQQDMHVYRGEKSKEDKERRKADELIAVVKEIFLHTSKLSYKNLSELLIQEMEIKDRTAKRYITYMREQGILSQDTAGNYQKGERCRT